jgi:hypothetical protein
MRLRRWTAALTGCCLVLAASVADAADVHFAGAASALADADLGLIQLPAGAIQLAGSPNTALDQPSQITAVTSIVDHNLWWTVPGSQKAFLAYLASHPPQGFDQYLTSSGGSSSALTWGYGRGGLGSNETLLITVVQVGDDVDVRADAQVIWTPDKTPAEIIPATLASATFDYKGPMPGSYKDDSTTPKPAHAHRVLTGKALRRVAADLNSLPTQALGGEFNCPMDTGERGQVHAVYGGQHVTFDIALSGCRFVDATANGAPQPGLGGDTRSLIADLYATIGVRFTPIPVTPPQGPVAHTAPPHLSLQHSKVQAQRVADSAPGLGSLPSGAQNSRPVTHPSRPPYTGSGTAVDRGNFWTVKGTVAELANYFQAHAAKGYIAAQPGKDVHGVRRLVLEPKTHPKLVTSLLWVSMVQKGGSVVFRLDGQAAWKA